MKSIIFNAEMAKSLVKGQKLQTRRLLKIKNENFQFKSIQGFDKLCAIFDNSNIENLDMEDYKFECVSLPYKCGDILWVREPAKIETTFFDKINKKWYINFKYSYQKNTQDINTIEIPSRILGTPLRNTMPKWITHNQGVPNGCLIEMARFKVIITSIKVERLQEASKEDIYQEGFDEEWYNKSPLNQNYKVWWESTWNSVSKQNYKYEDNPYVVAYTFVVKEMENGK